MQRHTLTFTILLIFFTLKINGALFPTTDNNDINVGWHQYFHLSWIGPSTFSYDMKSDETFDVLFYDSASKEDCATLNVLDTPPIQKASVTNATNAKVSDFKCKNKGCCLFIANQSHRSGVKVHYDLVIDGWLPIWVSVVTIIAIMIVFCGGCCGGIYLCCFREKKKSGDYQRIN